MIATLGRYATAFGRFWWDFLVGDTPEIFVGVLAVVAVALALHHERAAALVTVPVLVVVLLAVTTYRGRQRARGA